MTDKEGVWMYITFRPSDTTAPMPRFRRYKFLRTENGFGTCNICFNTACIYVEGFGPQRWPCYYACETCWLRTLDTLEGVPVTFQETLK